MFPSSKGDKEGKNSHGKHIYANPENPEICPILSLAIYLWSIGFRRNGSKRTVFGGNEENNSRFSKWLKSVCLVLGATFMAMGILIAEIGSHSFRKGIACFLSSLPGGPTAISIYLRAGWSLGAVPNRYILEGEGGDQLCGRAATGLTLTDPKFAVLPPHFDDTDGKEILTLNEWEDILPGYSTFYPVNFRQVCPFLLASIVHHREYLETTLPSDHPLKVSRLWSSGIIPRLADRVLTGCNRHPTSKLVATGVPPNVMLANEIVKLREEFGNRTIMLLAKVEEIPEKVKESMLQNFQISGAVPITKDQVEALINELRADIRDMRSISVPAPTQCRNESEIAQEFQHYCWGGHFHPVPEGFRFPKCCVKQIWDLWWGGHIAMRIGPYSMIRSNDLLRPDRPFLSKAKKVGIQL